ncbi:hypothetical protein LMG31506_05645 [Cupriavidus yeoncheonensis]|uniref:Nucleoside 2-deoxyribosyltransferase n=1 Tax=Cupriavidus yeoncheonensis TaxID=1462994 RepID=A0A916J0Y2_9BURK|nr:nucleoside 2-deoxyribosyltransferase [Cupriavidus yeoncheonensis]CAG2156247.1 hypothetical protein LMG31506_05645 [Cupriavidus yeoncheonensis]
MKTLYLAGFDVFREDAVEWGGQLKALCTEYGFEGLYPLDKAAPAGMSGPDTARWIYDANIALIRRADMVMANLGDFRGPGEPDSGTAFEVGFAVALQKPVWGYYGEDGSLRERVIASIDDRGHARDKQGYLVEDFGLPKNLMLACPAKLVRGGPKECLQAMVDAERRHTVRRERDAALRDADD